MIRILLADDENLIRSALAALLGLEDDLEVVAQAADGHEALAMAAAHRPDVAGPAGRWAIWVRQRAPSRLSVPGHPAPS